MSYPSIFLPRTTERLIERIDTLLPETKALWGKMDASQMLAHCCVPYEQILGESNERTPLAIRLILRLFFKQAMVNEVPFKKNLSTAPSFSMVGKQKEFDAERRRLSEYIQKIELLGTSHFEGKIHSSLGALSSQQWSNLLYKHLDHHLGQFGA